MPPRKSTSSTAAADPDLPSSTPAPAPAQNVQATEQQLKARAEGGVSIEDYLLPRSLTLRLAKSVLPPNTAIQKDAVLAIQKAATVFVSYLSSHANEATLKRTIAPADVFAALSELELDAFRDRLERELEAFTELKAGKRKAKKTATEEGMESKKPTDGGEEVAEEEPAEENTVRGAKRVKRAEDGSGVKRQDDEGDDDDDTQDEPEMQGQENEEEEEDEAEDEEEDEDEDETQEEEDDNDIDRVEDLDHDSRAKRTMDPDAAGDETDSDDEDGPGSQLQSGLGMG